MLDDVLNKKLELVKKRCMMGVLSYAALGCTCASLVFSIISIALPYWQFSEIGVGGFSVKYYSGLWSYCKEQTSFGKSESKCTSFEEVQDFFKATRALEILGLLLVVSAGAIGALKLFVMKENELFVQIAGGLAVAAGVFMITGAIIYAAKTQNQESTLLTSQPGLHAGFALAIVSGVISFISSGLFFASKSN
ncbi:hypothetical protein CHS0354_003944 [Potamilus streckersoni]|uniref:Claudin n=1 Tax=Potamilus streckersoni TaxID=2493646 RepID=A0AAE0T7Q9_9BIVA|nr:hypothetical protein CHS0354_003944 [Potamilus streckersoni]